MNGSGQAQKEKCGIRKARFMGGVEDVGGAKAGREYENAVPNGWSSMFKEMMVSGKGLGEVTKARCSW